MFCSNQTRAFLLVAAVIFGCAVSNLSAQNSPPLPPPVSKPNTSVHLRWGPQSGVSRYRVQLAHDRAFADIVFDRVVNGYETEINDLDPGRYFWRVAPLAAKLGEFSSAGIIEVKPPAPVISPQSTTSKPNVPAKTIPTGGGWRAAIGNISSAVAAHLRLVDRSDLVAMNSEGVVTALDAATGVALWSSRMPAQPGANTASTGTMLIVPDPSRLDNVVILRGTAVVLFEGRTGRELARWTLPSPAASGAVISDQTGSSVLVVDNSRQRLFVLSRAGEAITAQVKLPARVIGAPAVFSDQGKGAFALAYDTGDLEIRDPTGAFTRAVNLNSLATTAPLFVRGRRGDLILVGTRDGLIAITPDLRPLGRMTIPNDAPRGTLVAQDLDGDGVAEVIMTTERRHLIAVNSTDGKILWDVPAGDYSDALAFADINQDHVFDVFITAGQRFAVALSGRDGSVIWKDDEAPVLATNHAVALESHSLFALPQGAGILLIAAEPSHTGLRAISFSQAEIRPNP
jgi:outer membrane protein assembly factor BamB